MTCNDELEGRDRALDARILKITWQSLGTEGSETALRACLKRFEILEAPYEPRCY